MAVDSDGACDSLREQGALQGLPSRALLRSLSSPCATVRAASRPVSLPTLDSDRPPTAPEPRRLSLREKQDAAIQATWLRRQAIKLQKDQDRARRQRLLYSAKKASLDGITNESLKSWSLAQLPASVALSFPPPHQSHAEGERSLERHSNLLLCGFLEHSVEATEDLLEVLRLEPDDNFFDLGSGDGRVVTSVVKRFGCKGVGVELNRLLVQQANAHAQMELAMTPHLVNNVTFIQGDISRMNLSEAQVIFIYMPRTALRTLLCKVLLRTGIQDGTLIYTSENWLSRKEAPHLKHKESYWKPGIHCYEWHLPH